jgi:tetratricopeptide (TPR) repeat protein
MNNAVLSILAIVVWSAVIGWGWRATVRNKRTEQNQAADYALALSGENKEKIAQVCNLYPNSPTPFVCLIHLKLKEGKLDEGLKDIQVIKKRFPRNVIVALLEVHILKRLGQTADAEAALRSAVARFPNDLRTAIALGEVAMENGDWPEAVRRWALVRERFPELCEGYEHGATALARCGNLPEAKRVALQGLDRFPARAGLVRWIDVQE